MNRKNRTMMAVVCAAAAVSLAACSSTGGKNATSTGSSGAANSAAAVAGKASTPTMTVAMITHAQPGDTFWDIIRKGASAAAQKDNINYTYSNSAQAPQEAQLIQAAIDKKVDGIAVTDPNTPALSAVIKKAVAAGIPVSMFNAGEKDAMSLGAIGYFGQDELVAGKAAGKRLAAEGAKNVLCVDQTAGQQQLLDRCNGTKQGLGSEGKMEQINVDGTDDSAVTSSIQAKLAQDPSIDYVLTLGAPYALDAVKSVSNANSKAKVVTFDTNQQLVGAIKSGKVLWAVDQQPYLEGYLAIDSLWLYKTNGDTIGGGQPVLTGPSFIDSSNIAAVAKYAAKGTR
ncbi:sugar ABC transporter substrate-binding protein [Leekyejoonella antrihumi]|uniref:Sugar ABC transporter substrate-binding protein n=1 Tax=Leekyejoonella antrihumi TaxID=1660198 RepID=A0A563E7U7_9MICO|nr:sugar ABC transporter substrate-binding protein [Leekyejoonella antrihumi]TWP38282.1 sugar ABC transporter substrate-binding protein [Leekyejoonella antrihumi]